MSASVRVRIAPSPTGNLHIGTARTTLFNYLYARHTGGVFVLRIEDTDRERSKAEFVSNILDGMRWLSLNWDEGPDVNGPYASYYQSEREPFYRAALDQLAASGHTFPCFCTTEELAADKASAEAENRKSVYSGRCRHLSQDEQEAKKAAGIPMSIRFHVPSGEITIHDTVRKDITFEDGLIGDFVLMKSDGTPTYNFAVVVDDAQMQITHVIRGDDHISNTPRQIMLYQALGYPIPQFTHTPMILGPDKAKLSKRHGAVSVTEYANMGFLPEALVNALALLSWSPADGQELFTLEDAVKNFTLDRLTMSAAVFDLQKLRWFNHQHIVRLGATEIAKRCRPFFTSEGVDLSGKSDEWFERAIALILDKLEVLPDAVDHLRCLFEQPVLTDEIREAALKTEAAKPVLAACCQALTNLEGWDAEKLHDVIKQVAKDSGFKMKEAMWAIRAALTGKTSGADLSGMAYLLGRDECLARINLALDR